MHFIFPRHPLAVLVSLLLALLVLTGCDRTPEISRLTPYTTIVAYGDSLTHGNGAGAGKTYPDVLSALLNIPVINAGVPGETTSGGLKRLPGVLDEYQPDLVILCEGGNDFLRRQNQERLFANLRQMVEMIRASGADVILVGVPQMGLLLDTHPGYEQLAGEMKVPVEDEIVAEILGERSLKSDTIHPNAAGYRLMAEAIHELIEKAQP